MPTRVERRAVRRSRLARWSFKAMVLGFVLLLASAGTIAFAQLRASHVAPWISVGLSAAVVVLTALALFLRPRT